MTAPFGSSVFVNCPFDQHYMPILRAVLFAIIDLKFEPRIATERLDSAEPRIQKLYTLIRQSRLAIHDLSRIKARKKGEMFRLNNDFVFRKRPPTSLIPISARTATSPSGR